MPIKRGEPVDRNGPKIRDIHPTLPKYFTPGKGVNAGCGTDVRADVRVRVTRRRIE